MKVINTVVYDDLFFVLFTFLFSKTPFGGDLFASQ